MRQVRWVWLLSLALLVIVIVGCGGDEKSNANSIPGFKYLKEETFSCGGQTNTVKIYNHEKTGLNFVLLPGNKEIEPFLICQTEATQAAWKKVMETEPWSGKDYVKEGDDYPATYLTWDDCVSFCKRTGFRLPTEEEWKIACRAGTTTDYCFGDSESDLGDYAWFYDNTWDVDEKYAHQVGQKKPNAFGLYDMHGNVWEWCQDLHESGSSLRVFRGGSWSHSAEYCRSADRSRRTPDRRYGRLGFRLALSCD